MDGRDRAFKINLQLKSIRGDFRSRFSYRKTTYARIFVSIVFVEAPIIVKNMKIGKYRHDMSNENERIIVKLHGSWVGMKRKHQSEFTKYTMGTV